MSDNKEIRSHERRRKIMRVKIGNKIYDGRKEPIMIILNDEEKQQIADMAPDATKYCQYPDTEEWTANDYARIKEWMQTDV